MVELRWHRASVWTTRTSYDKPMGEANNALALDPHNREARRAGAHGSSCESRFRLVVRITEPPSESPASDTERGSAAHVSTSPRLIGVAVRNTSRPSLNASVRR